MTKGTRYFSERWRQGVGLTVPAIVFFFFFGPHEKYQVPFVLAGPLEVTISFVGDIMIARRYEQWLEKHRVEEIFEPTREIFLKDDFSVGNLEAPITTATSFHPKKKYVFAMHPKYAPVFKYAGFDLFNLANNHIYDCLEKGVLETKEVLRKNGLSFFGAKEPLIIEKKGIRFAFLGFNGVNPREGGAVLTKENIKEGIKEVRNKVEFVIVQMHHGKEYARVPTFKQRRLSHFAIRQGADMVISHHPHVLQGFEIYQGKLIAHSLGNFVFDQQRPETLSTIILQCQFRPTGVEQCLILPIFIDGFVPKKALGQMGGEILNRLSLYSREWKTSIDGYGYVLHTQLF